MTRGRGGSGAEVSVNPILYIFLGADNPLQTKFNVIRKASLDQLAKPTVRSRYAHTPFGSAPLLIPSS